jgi:hypothetical protein
VIGNGPEPGRGDRAERVATLLAAAAPRHRTADEHMLTDDPATLRLQL